MKKKHPLKENYERFFGKIDENSSGFDDISVDFSHYSGDYAEIPEDILSDLPNNSRIASLQDKLNRMRNPPDPDHPLLFKYDKLVHDSVLKFIFSKIGEVEYDDSTSDDENISITFRNLDPKQINTLKKYKWITFNS